MCIWTLLIIFSEEEEEQEEENIMLEGGWGGIWEELEEEVGVDIL